MPQYLSPGVYVEEVPSAVKPIAGVSTSTAGFIGLVPGTFPIPPSMSVEGEKINPGSVDGIIQSFLLKHYPVATDPDFFTVRVGNRTPVGPKLRNEPVTKKSYVDVTTAPVQSDIISASYLRWVTDPLKGSELTTPSSPNKVKDLSAVPFSTAPADYEIRVKGAPAPAGATIGRKGTTDKYQVVFTGVTPLPADDDEITVKYKVQVTEEVGTGKKDGKTAQFDLAFEPIQGSLTVTVNGNAITPGPGSQQAKSQVTVTLPPPRGSDISVDYLVGGPIKNQPLEAVGAGVFKLSDYPVLTDTKTFDIRVDGSPVPKGQVTIQSGGGGKPSTVKLTGVSGSVTADYAVFATFDQPPPVGKAVLCTSFSQYKNSFGDFSTDPGQSTLTHAVYGFFNNGGTRCYVARIETKDQIDRALTEFERVSEIAIVAAPGVDDDDIRGKIDAHCRKMGDRFAIFDGPEVLKPDELPKLTKINAGSDPGVMPKQTDYAAWYFPWIKVSDPISKMLNRAGDGNINVPPSGHIAGVYARVDTERGVHKAPANVPIFGALDVAQQLSKAEQDGVNPKGVNCIRVINNNILVWGARTIGGDDNTDLKYINVRRTLLFLSKSINDGTQWAVFEPNTSALWQKITRNVTAFLTNVWRSGALFGDTAQQAFYVKCDAETNPPSLSDLGQVVTEVGVAIARPAEFVIFRISQAAGAGK